MGWGYPSIRSSHIQHLPVLLIFLVLFAGANMTNETVPGNESGFMDVDEFLNITNEIQSNETTEEFVQVDEFLNLTEPEEQNETLDIPPLPEQNETQENETTEEGPEPEPEEEEFIEVEEFLNLTEEGPEPKPPEFLSEEKPPQKPEIPPGHVMVHGTIRNALGVEMKAEMSFKSEGKSKKTYNKPQIQDSLFVPPGQYDITINPRSHPIQEIQINNFEINGNVPSFVYLDQPDKAKVAPPPGIKFSQLYVFNPQEEISGTFTVRAKGTRVYKCKDWDFYSQICMGEWTPILNVTPGELYTIEFDPADPAYGEESDYFTLTTITLDGDFTDWEPVLANEHNTMPDGISGINDLDIIGTPNRDLIQFAFTWDEDYFYTYYRRTASGTNVCQMLNYIDANNDNKIGSTDYVIKYSWLNNQGVNTWLYNYTPSIGGGDPITGDGQDENGSISNVVSLESDLPGRGPNGIIMESRFNWSAVGLTPGAPFGMHVSTAQGTGTNLPAQVEDNLNPIYTLITDIDIEPPRSGSGNNGDTVSYNHTITNIGNQYDTVNVNTSGTDPGFTVNIYHANGTPITDTNGDSVEDVGPLAPGASMNITVNITIAGASQGDVDQTYVIATSGNNTNVSDNVLDTTYIGALVIYPTEAGLVTSGSSIVYNHTVASYISGSNVIDIIAISNNTYVVNLTYANGTYLTDTNSDTFLDVGNLSEGEEILIQVHVWVPVSAVIGTIDLTTITALQATDFSINSSVTDTSTVSPSIEIFPNRTGFIAVGAGDYVFYQHTVRNSLNVSDVADLTYLSSQGWNVTFYHEDMCCPLNDTDGDGLIDTGNISAWGGTKVIYAKLHHSGTVAVNTTDITNITANSSVYTSEMDYVIDNTTARILITYENAIHTIFEDTFRKSETAYANSYGLSSYSKVYYLWYDSNGTLQRMSPDIDVDGNDEAQDLLPLNYSLPSGEYVVYLRNAQNDDEITHEFFYVFGVPNVIVVSPNGGEVWSGTNLIYYNVTDDSGENITALIQYSSNGGTSWVNLTTQQLNTTNCTYNASYQCVEGQFNYSWDTTTVSDGINYLIRVIADNTYFNGTDDSNAVFTINNAGTDLCYISGIITTAFGSTVFSETRLYNYSSGGFLSNQTEDYNFTVYCNEKYDFVVRPDTGNFKELRVIEINVTTNITEVVDLEDSPNDMESPESVLNWTEAISWYPNETMNYSAITINVSYGNSTDLAFYKCTNWTYDQRNCTDDNWTYVTDVTNGPGLFVYNFSYGDPGAGIANKPNVTTMLKVYDVTGLPEAGRINAGSLVGTFYNGTQVNFTYGKSYRLEMYLNNTDNNTNGIIKDPYYDNIQEELGIDMVGADAPNITVVLGAVTINAFTPTNVAGTESGTRRLTWDAAHPHKVIERLELGDLVKLWLVVDFNQTNQSINNATFYGDVQGTLNDAVQINPFNTSGSIFSSCVIISSAGTYVLSQNVVGAPFNASEVPSIDWACVKIASSNVDFSCYGYNITNNGTAEAAGIVINGSSSINYTNVTIRDCPGISSYEVGLGVYSSSQDTVQNITAYNNSYGIQISSTRDSIVTNNTVYDSTGSFGIYSFYSSYVNYTDNNAHNNTRSFRLYYSDNNYLANNTAWDNLVWGITLYSSNNNTLFNNTVHNNSEGISLSASLHNVVASNLAYNNSDGISISGGSYNNLTDNLARNNTNRGIAVLYMTPNVTLVNNTAYWNGRGFYAQHSEHTVFINNTAHTNNQEGFDTDYLNYTTLTNNTAYDNLDGFEFRDSLYTAVAGNTAHNNSEVGFNFYYANHTNFTNNTARYNGEEGFVVADSHYARMVENAAHNNTQQGFFFTDSNHGTLTRNIAYNNTQEGFVIENAANNTFISNSAYYNVRYGFDLYQSFNNTFTFNDAYRNSFEGFYLKEGDNNTLTNNTAYENSRNGFILNGAVNYTLIDNTAYNNTNGFYLVSFSAGAVDNELINNSAYNNSFHGIEIDSGVNDTILSGNNLTENGQYGIAMDSGSYSSTLTSNYVCFNDVTDLYNQNSTNTGTLDTCDTWNSWSESSHEGCAFRCTEVWHYFYGNVSGSLLLAPTQADIFYSWAWNGQNGKVYAVSINASIDWPSLVALGRNTSIQNSTNDFTELDTLLGISSEPDNINATYSYDGSNPMETRNWTLFELAVDYLPVANSSVFTNGFFTGIAWDSSQDGGGGQFDPADNEDVVFVTEINGTAPNDYEIKVPESLATYKGGNLVEFWVELD